MVTPSHWILIRRPWRTREDRTHNAYECKFTRWSAQSTHRRKEKKKREKNQLTRHRRYDIRSTPRGKWRGDLCYRENKITNTRHAFSFVFGQGLADSNRSAAWSLFSPWCLKLCCSIILLACSKRSCRRYEHDRCLNIRHVTYAWRNAVAREASSPPTYRLRNTSRRGRASATVRFPGARSISTHLEFRSLETM